MVAIAENGVIGQGGGMPWRLKSDLRRFRALTIGKPVLMGRKTYRAIGRPLPERTNIVVSARVGTSPRRAWLSRRVSTSHCRSPAATRCAAGLTRSW